MTWLQGQLTSRLAALHRGVVRALQLLVQQMSDGGDHRSVARDYRDLAIIIRQLSICCAQLEVTNESSLAQEDLLNLLKDFAVSYCQEQATKLLSLKLFLISS